MLPFLSTTYVVGYEYRPEVNVPASLLESNHTLRYDTPFFDRISFASEIAALSPSSVKVLMPTTVPPFFASSVFRASKSFSSSTHGLQVVNQKFTTVTSFLEKRSLLFTSLPSKSLPVKLGNFVSSLFSFVMPALSASTLSPSPDLLPQSGYFCSRMVSFPSISLICSAPVFSVCSSSAEN